MNSGRRRNSQNYCAIHTCFGCSRHCAVYTIFLGISTSIFVTCMILSVYLTNKGNMDKIVVVLIVGSSLLYLLGFSGNMYSIYHCRPNYMPSGNGENPNLINQTTGVSVQSSSTNGQPPDVACFPHVRELLRKTPPPPYEIQMSEMSRMLLPGTSRTIESSTRELEIAEEARKLIQRIYEEIRRTDYQMPQSPRQEQSMQQMMQMSNSPVRQQDTMLPNVSGSNLIVQRQQTDVKSISARGPLPIDSHTNQVIQQKAALFSHPTQLDLERLVIGSEGCTADLPQLSPKREDRLKSARKRNQISPSKKLQTRSKTTGNVTHVMDYDNNSQNKACEEIESVRTFQSTNSPQAICDSVEYYCLERSPPEQASSVGSVASEHGQVERMRKYRNSSVKIRRQLSALSTKKFRQLGRSPETVLDAIATCFDLAPDEWMVAWKLGHKGVSPRERANILGVRLHRDSYNDDN